MIIGKEFLDINEQVSHLKSVGIDVGDGTYVKKVLEKNSYYTIINGYRRPFLFQSQPNRYLFGVSFKEIYNLYLFDIRLRNCLFPFILEIENQIKTEIIYEFSSKRDGLGQLIRPKDEYLKIDNYDIGLGSSNDKKMSSAIDLISTLQRTISMSFDYSSAFKHYLTKYAYIPLWVLSTQMTFGEISKFYENMMLSDRQAVARKYRLPENDFKTILKALTLARNSCAHGNRTYCFFQPLTLPIPLPADYPTIHSFLSRNIGQNNLFGILLCIKYFISQSRFDPFINNVAYHIECLAKQLKTIPIDRILSDMGFPNNWKDIKN